MIAPRFVDSAAIRAALTASQAADALESALRAGLDPEAETPRSRIAAGDGQLLIMPAPGVRYVTVKLLTLGGVPQIQGLCVAIDSVTLAPTAILDGAALTLVRTAAVSLVAARHLVRRCGHILVFGTGPQGQEHARALRIEFGGDDVKILGRGTEPDAVAHHVRRADVICCATTAREPLFDGADADDEALVIAIGSHEPSAREVDERFVHRSAVVVESRASARREAGELIAADLAPETTITLAELVVGARVPDGGPRLFKSTGMSWEDNVVATAILDALPGPSREQPRMI